MLWHHLALSQEIAIIAPTGGYGFSKTMGDGVVNTYGCSGGTQNAPFALLNFQFYFWVLYYI